MIYTSAPCLRRSVTASPGLAVRVNEAPGAGSHAPRLPSWRRACYRLRRSPAARRPDLVRVGLSFGARLAMLTTGPAARFGASSTGRLAPGLDADLVVLDGDPAADPTAFARVRCTLRRGVVVYAAGACGR